MKPTSRVLIFTIAFVGLIRTTAQAYQRYNDGCQDCHGAFTDSTSTKGSTFLGGDKHEMHRNSSYMATDCNLCHTSGDNRNPFIGSSTGVTGVPGLGCTGCHGRNEDMGHDTQSAGRGAGLRQHHFNTGTAVCADCHSDANPTDYTPVAENVNPPYYGTTATKAKNPCNPVAAQGTNENWTVGAPYEGLDNDGNNLYDGNDPACGVTCTYTISPSSTNMTSAGGIGSIGVTAATSCVWTATPSAAWITITSGGTGSGNGAVNYSVAINATSLARTGTVSIATKTFTVIQAGGCSYAINPSSTNMTAAGGAGSVAVTAGTGCAWTAASGSAWVTITSGSSGSGNGNVGYSVAANASSLSRTGTATIAGLTFTVRQSGVACNYVLNPTTQTFTSNGGTGSFGVTAAAGCAWTATTADSWITSTSSGTGNGSVNFSVGANASSLSRTGTIAVAGQNFTVTQSGATCTYALNPTSQAFASGSGTGTFGVTTPAGCAWMATTSAAWVTITSGSGTGNGNVNFSVGANSSSIARTGTITVASQTFTVTQTGVACTYSIAPTNATYAAAGGAGSVNVTAPVGCAWTSASNASWITVTSGASGSGNGSVGYSIATNSTSSLRSGTMTIAGQTFTVTQSGTSCTYSINPASQAFTSSGGTGTFNVNTTAGCAWSAATGDAWITTTSSGSGSGVVNFVVASNTSSLSRTGMIVVAGQTFTVTQTGVACTYSLNPTSQAFGANVGTGSFGVTAPGGCAWSTTSNDAWITVTGGASGSGNGTVDYSVAANVSSGARTGTVSIAGQTFTVTQSGAGCTYSLSPTNQTFAAAGGPGSANVAAPGGCAWTATSNDAWITITGGASGSGNGTVSYSVAGNTSSLTRVGTLTIAGKTLTVTQLGVACTYVLTPTGQTFDSNGSSASFNVTAAVGCAWSATANASWLSVVSTGTNSVGYSVAPNTTSLTRTGTITVATQLFTVIQTGVACTFGVNPLSADFAAGGGGGSLTASAPGGCAWTAASNDGWIAIASGSAGSGNGTVTFNVGANTSTSSRTGTLIVAEQTFAVTQAGASAAGVDLDIARFNARRSLHLGSERGVRIQLWIRNGGTVDAPREATVVGVQNGETVYRQTLSVSAPVGRGRVRYEFSSYKPTAVGDIQWTVTIADDDPDVDVATDTTRVKGYHQ